MIRRGKCLENLKLLDPKGLRRRENDLNRKLLILVLRSFVPNEEVFVYVILAHVYEDVLYMYL